MAFLNLLPEKELNYYVETADKWIKFWYYCRENFTTSDFHFPGKKLIRQIAKVINSTGDSIDIIILAADFSSVNWVANAKVGQGDIPLILFALFIRKNWILHNEKLSRKSKAIVQ